MKQDLRFKNKTIRKNLAFTLTEILLVMGILLVMVTILIGIINPVAMVNKARDSRRKSDLNKIRTAFEEYFTDKGYYPSATSIGSSWNLEKNCGKQIDEVKKYLRVWPCDPDNKPYVIIANDNYFKIVVNLENKKDKDIPIDWYETGTYTTSAFYNQKQGVNYGVSSSNILWYDGDTTLPPQCGSGRDCIKKIGGLPVVCNFDNDGCSCSVLNGDICWLGSVDDACLVSSCCMGTCN